SAPVLTVAHQLMKQCFGPVQQSGVKVIHCQLQGNLGRITGRQLGPGKKILVNQNGAVCLSLVPEMAANGEMQADGVFVDGKGLNEVIDGLIRVVGKEKLQTIPNGILVHNGSGGAARAVSVSTYSPASGNGRRQKQPLKQHVHQS